MTETENMVSTEADTGDVLEEPSITMVDILAHEKELEDEYAAVLGASDDKCCTYNKGPVKRQALYSCLTCNPDSIGNIDKCAGICLACSLHCHENHELVELYTKRNFRCDCPTQRFPNVKCVLNPEVMGEGDQKMPINESNVYNQNFQGVYCTCKRPYPDPEATNEEEMLQCAICEDWYHLHHLGLNVKKLRSDYHEMVCPGCMQKYEFLQDYVGLALTRLEEMEESNVCVAENDDKLKSDLDKSISEIMNMSGDGDTATGENEKAEDAGTSEAKANLPEPKRQKTGEPTGCRRPKTRPDYDKNVATLWMSDWRSALCRCKDCLRLYESFKVTFLLDPEDSAAHYEERGRKVAKESSYEQGIKALSSIGRTQQIDAITEYNRMKDKLKEFLHTFVVNKKVVTEDDINRFFQEMKNEKNSSLGQPYLCH